MTARILVADGLATTRITLKVRLSAACYDVTTANSLEQIPALIHRSAPDLIILGAGFAPYEAIAFCQSLIADRDTGHIPVLVLAHHETRLALLQSGASATLDPDVSDQMLLARVRCLLRDAEPRLGTEIGFAEAPQPFDRTTRPRIVLVTDMPGRAQRWRQMLSERLDASYDIRNPEEALFSVRSGKSADLYLICADLDGRGDGLRLLSELRARQGSRDAGFIVALAPDREELAAIALDLGAGDVLPDSLGGVEGIDATVEMLRMQLSRKSRLEQHRAEVERHMLWAMTDPLTGLFNRRYALPRLTEIAREAMAKSLPFSVLALDLDHFKDVNDQHGHGAGDAVLSVVAQRMQQVLAARGMAARLGGEEFAVVLCPCAEDQAAVIAERLRLAVQDSPVALPDLSGGGQCSVTVSVGVVTVRPHSGDWPDILAQQTLECADRALLAAKGQGRNRVVISGTRHAA